MKWTNVLLIALFIPLQLSLCQNVKPDQSGIPPVRRIPGITVEDKFPNGCVDCHTNHPEMNQDHRLTTILSSWNKGVNPEILKKAQNIVPAGIILKGVHPDIRDSVKMIPSDCRKCHSKASKTAPMMYPLMHLIHLTGGEKNHFLTVFQGECTHCHKLNPEKGTWAILSGPEK